MLEINCRIDSAAIACRQSLIKKHDVLDKIATIANDAYGLPKAAISEALLERENLGSTGFGGGIAIPHCKITGLEAPLGVFLSLEKPIDYDSIDDEPVDIIFSLLSPSNNGAMHLHALAEVSRLLRDEKSCARLRGASSEDAIFSMLSVNSELNAA